MTHFESTEFPWNYKGTTRFYYRTLDLFRLLAVFPSAGTGTSALQDVEQTEGALAAPIDTDGTGAPDLSVGAAETKFNPTGTLGFEDAALSGGLIVFNFSDD